MKYVYKGLTQHPPLPFSHPSNWPGFECKVLSYLFVGHFGTPRDPLDRQTGGGGGALKVYTPNASYDGEFFPRSKLALGVPLKSHPFHPHYQASTYPLIVEVCARSFSLHSCFVFHSRSLLGPLEQLVSRLLALVRWIWWIWSQDSHA